MRRIIPGGSYSYDSATNTIQLSTNFSLLSIENILSIRNLSKNKNIYDSERPVHQLTVRGGLIIHSYPGLDADEDKLQIKIIKNNSIEILTSDGYSIKTSDEYDLHLHN